MVGKSGFLLGWPIFRCYVCSSEGLYSTFSHHLQLISRHRIIVFSNTMLILKFGIRCPLRDLWVQDWESDVVVYLAYTFFGIVRFRSSGVIKFYSWLGGDQRMRMHGNVEGFALNDAFIQVGNRMIPPVSPYSFCPCQFQVFFPTFHATSIHPNEGQYNLQLWKMILRCQIDMTRRSPRTCKAVTWVLWCIKNQGDRKHFPMQNHKKHIPTNKKSAKMDPPSDVVFIRGFCGSKIWSKEILFSFQVIFLAPTALMKCSDKPDWKSLDL